MTVGENNETFFFIDESLGNRCAVFFLAADLFNRPVPIDGRDILSAESLVDLWLIDVPRSTMAQEGFLNRIIEVFIDVFAWKDGKALSLTRFNRGD